MSKVLFDYSSINKSEWEKLAVHSSVSSWFQTENAYLFYQSVSDMLTPFVVAVENNGLRGVAVGYITREKNALKQLMTQRAIIIGGPLLSDDIEEDELRDLLHGLRSLLRKKAIYIETRNFHSYTKWKPVFASCGFVYNEHLNFQVDCSSDEVIMNNMDRGRKRNIKSSIKEGCVMIEQPTLEQVREFYDILLDLYRTKVKLPLFPFDFFEKLYNSPDGHYFLVSYEGKIVGGTACVIHKNKAVYEWFGCGLDGVIKGVYPSTFSTYQGMIYAMNNRIPILDMMGAGAPKDDYGVRAFKERFGGKLVEDGRFLCVCRPLSYLIGKIGVKILKILK